jgi:Pentapeptide repeats (8 copies)
MRFPRLVDALHLTIWIAPIVVVGILVVQSQRSALTPAAVGLGLIVALLAGWHLGAGVPNATDSDSPVAHGESSAGGVMGSSAVLVGADLSDADLTGADLRGVDLRGANLTRAVLRGANLRGAHLAEAAEGSAAESIASPWRRSEH